MKVYLCIVSLLLVISNTYLFYEVSSIQSRIKTLTDLRISISLDKVGGASHKTPVASSKDVTNENCCCTERE